jgi:hypothetical protein
MMKQHIARLGLIFVFLPSAMPANSSYIQLPSLHCLDGTLAGFYYRNATSASGSTKYVIFMEGGNDCASGDRCQEVVAKGGGTSKGRPPTLEQYFSGFSYGGAVLVDPAEKNNPDFFSAHHIYLPYCTCDFHAGQQTDTVNGTYWFQGHHIVSAVVNFLLQLKNSDTNPLVLFSGGSSGGMGTFRNLDFVADKIRAAWPKAQVRGVPIGGFYFWQHPYIGINSTTPTMDFSAAGFAQYYHTHRAYVPQGCATRMPHSPWLCSQANVSFPFIKTKTFVAEAQTDRVVTCNHAGLPTLTADIVDRAVSPARPNPVMAYVAQWSQWMVAALQLHVVQNSPDAGLFNPACYDHTNFATAAGPRIANHSFIDALGAWVFDRGHVPHKLFDSCGSPLCGAPRAVPALKQSAVISPKGQEDSM